MELIIPFYDVKDIYIAKAKGCYIFNNKGEKYLDFEAGDWAACLGHSNRRINTTFIKQVKKVVHDGLRFRNLESEKLSELLLNKLRFKNGRCVFLSSGSEAVNLGIRIAQNITKREKILTISGSFLGSFGVGFKSESNVNRDEIALEDFESIPKIDFSQYAAFVFEPGTSSGLIRFPSVNFINKIIHEAEKEKCMVLSNEVTCGFGRIGTWFGFNAYSFTPDIIAMGKALGNGYPISAVAVNKKVSDLFDQDKFRYAQSHQNDPLGCAVGIKVIREIERKGLIEKSNVIGDYFVNRLILLKEKSDCKIRDVRGKGLMIAIEFSKDIDVKEIYNKLISKWIIVGFKENVIRFMPPLIIKKRHVDELIERLDECIES